MVIGSNRDLAPRSAIANVFQINIANTKAAAFRNELVIVWVVDVRGRAAATRRVFVVDASDHNRLRVGTGEAGLLARADPARWDEFLIELN